jgi:hypothetical protein
MGRPILLLTFLTAVAIIAWQQIHKAGQIPHPSKFVYAGAVWAVLGVASELGAPELSAAFGVAFVIALAYRYFAASNDTQAAKVAEKPGPDTQAAPVQQKGA